MMDKFELNREHIGENRTNSLMLVTALNPRIGYDEAVKISKLALAETMALKQAEKLGFVRPEHFNRWIAPSAMTEPRAALPGGRG